MPKNLDWRWPFFTTDIELTNHCEQYCRFCPRAAISRSKGFIDKLLAKKIIRQLAAIKSRITFCGMGNPLLHPHFIEIMDYCREFAGFNFGVTIQAPALSAENRSKILRAAPGFVEISFPTIDPQLFSQLYAGESTENCLNQVEKLLQERSSVRGLCIVAVRTAAEKYSDAEIIDFWQKHDLACRILSCHTRGGNLKRQDMAISIARKQSNCGLFASHSFISCDGKLLACCHDLSGETEIADLNECNIEEAALKKLVMLEANMPFTLCKSCDEPQANRRLPDRPFPESTSARKRFMKAFYKSL